MRSIIKKSLLLIACLFLVATAAIAQNVSTKVRMKAKLERTGGRTENVQNYYYSRVDETSHRMALAVELWNYGPDEEKVELRTYFIGSAARSSGSSAQRIMDTKIEKITLKGKERLELSRISKPLVSRTYTDTFYGSGPRNRSGESYKGWIVALFKEGKLMSVEASNHMLKVAMEDPKKFAELRGDHD